MASFVTPALVGERTTPALSHGPIRVLLIEDEPADADLVRHHLQAARSAFELVHVDSFDRGVEVLGRGEFDAVLVALGLAEPRGELRGEPRGENGLDAVLQITARCTDLPVVALGSPGDERRALRAVQGGAQDCLYKEQLDPAGLERAIHYAIGRQRHDARVRYLAGHDPLTGLANRAFFLDRLAQSLSRARRRRSRVAVMFLDLDHFKDVNDRLGHAAGDQLLEQVADRLESALRAEDTVALFESTTDAVARLGGDEFAVLLEDVPSEEEAAQVAERLLRAMTTPVDLGEEIVRCGSSIGISIFPQDAGSVDTMLECADVAMYRAKARGRNGYQFFGSDAGARAGLSGRSAWGADLELELRESIEEGRFELHYQPQFDLRTGATVGAEALVRWRRSPGELVLPAEFLPTLVQSGQGVAFGRWVLREACIDLLGAGPSAPPRVAVKLAAEQVETDGLVDTVEDALEDTGLRPDRLQLQVSEWVVARDEERALEVLDGLRELGVGVVLEHFGVGRTSFAFLKHCPLQMVKIDRSFIVDVERGGRERSFASAMIHMAHDLDLIATAEGVERESQLRFLREQGCDVGQGYLLGRPAAPGAWASV